MSGALNELIEATKGIVASSEQREEQRRSFAFGNTALENPRITRKMIDDQAEHLTREESGG